MSAAKTFVYVSNADDGDLSTYKPISGRNDDYFRKGVTEETKHSWYKDEGALQELLAAVQGVGAARPVFLKVAPDLAEGDPERIVRAAIDQGIDAIIVSNTTVSRPPLKSRFRSEAGGLSGAPLKPLAVEALRRFRAAGGGEMPLIGVGGIACADDAWERIRAGASLVQLYSAMVYEGPGIARRIAIGLARRLERAGYANIAEAVGSE